MDAKDTIIVGIGELLWDVFGPDRRVPGGAPINFAFHAGQLGYQAFAVSKIGCDPLGDELLQWMQREGLTAEYIQRSQEYPTGTVTVQVRESGQPDFTITENVAWDYLQCDASLLELAGRAAAVCFGSLAQRNDVSRRTIQQVVQACGGLKVCDINLRQHFYDPVVLETSLRLADVLKLNHEELDVLADMFGATGDMAARSRRLLERFDMHLVCVTLADHGSLLVGAADHARHEGFKVQVVDAVGCGDAFCAVLVDGVLRQRSLSAIAESANRAGAFVATQQGGTPNWPPDLVRQVRS